MDIQRLAAQITALQRGRTSRRDEQAIAELFLCTTAAALTALKNAVDAGEDYRTLHQLVYHDLDDSSIRARILEHFRAHARPSGALKILSDIDDTFYLNWRDTRYPAKTVYPGVRALYHELDLGPEADGRIGDLVFLTARPYDRLGLTDRGTHQMLHAHGVAQSTILPGDFAHLLTNGLIAEAKYRRFTELVPLFPEYQYVFLGDSGQGDVLAGGLMLALPDSPVRAVFIHDVVNTPEHERAAHRAKRIFFHDTYLGAAVDAFEQGLISRAGLARIAGAALHELQAVPFASTEQRAAMQYYYRRDLSALNAHLPAADRLAL